MHVSDVNSCHCPDNSSTIVLSRESIYIGLAGCRGRVMSLKDACERLLEERVH